MGGSSGATSIAGSAGKPMGASGSTSGTAGNVGSAGAGTTSTGGASGMTYNIVGQSCVGGLTCFSSTSCCAQLEVSAGSYSMGTNTDASRATDESPPHTATIDRFLMDKFEVTVGRFRKFLSVYDGTLPAGGEGAHPKIANSGWQIGYDANMPASRGSLQSMINCSTGQYQTWTDAAGVRESMPMNCVSWYVAFAFCIWDGGRLPTEAEWEMAATNGSNDTRFPWGSTDPVPATHAVMNCLGDGTTGCSPSDILAVGSRASGANQAGHLDLAGNLWEWTLDYYDATYYQSVGTCSNCASLSGLTPRVIRGGNFTSTFNALRATGRASKAPITADPYAGFRCVRTP
jgi:formylglycine-generating enzyme required for sulfatase activity